MSEEDKLRLY